MSARRIVLYRGQRCVYGNAFRAVFHEHARAHPDVPHEERVLDERDPASWDAVRVAISPTVVLYEGPAEAARLPGKPLLGISRTAFARWWRQVAGSGSEA